MKQNLRNDLTYRQVGEYLLPELEAPETPKIGVWGQRHERYLKRHQKGVYAEMLANGTLDSYLRQIDEHAERMVIQLVNRIAETEGVTEQLKAADQMEWVRRMNSIRNRAEEVVFAELIYV